jgi:hypothetical protein
MQFAPTGELFQTGLKTLMPLSMAEVAQVSKLVVVWAEAAFKRKT